MFYLVTGAPGSSKTSHVLARLMDVKDRPVYYRGIRNLQLEWHELSDDQARMWHEHVPDNAIVVIDEVQDIFPQRPLSKPTPEGCSILSKHRHRGLDVYFITQAPTAVDHEARKYVNEHFHYSRSFGAPIVTEYHKGNGVIDLSDKWALKNDCNKRQVRLPKKVWGLYKSAEVHTHKFKIPSRLYIIPVLIIAIVAAVYFLLSLYDKKQSQALGQPVATPAEHLEALSMPGQVPPTRSPDQWATLTKPRIRGLPYTAPLYDGPSTQVKSVPVISGCMSFKADLSDCKCYTQQGTRITDMDHPMCVAALKYGVFNHLQDDSERSIHKERERGNGSPAAPRITADQANYTAIGSMYSEHSF